MELPVSSSTGSMELDLDLERTPTPSESPLPLTTSEIPIAPLPMPSTPTRRRSIFQPIPPSLLKPGTEMLKVSAKSTRRVQTKKIWLELGSGFGSGDIRLCWDKNGRGVGAFRETAEVKADRRTGKRRQASIPISTIRDFRHGVDIAPYRTSLHLSPLVESRWMTIIYLVPSAPSVPLSFINNGVQTPAYKLAHLIAPTEESFLLWRETLTAFLDERTGGEAGDWEELRWREAGGGAEAVEHEEVDVRVVKEDEVLRLCRRLGVGMGKDQIATAFRVSPFPILVHADARDRNQPHPMIISTLRRSRRLSSCSNDESTSTTSLHLRRATRQGSACHSPSGQYSWSRCSMYVLRFWAQRSPGAGRAESRENRSAVQQVL